MLSVVARSRIDGISAGYVEIRRRRHGGNDRAPVGFGAVKQDLVAGLLQRLSCLIAACLVLSRHSYFFPGNYTDNQHTDNPAGHEPEYRKKEGASWERRPIRESRRPG